MSRILRRFIALFTLFGIIAGVSAQDFQPAQAEKWNDFFCIENEICEVGDVNGDGLVDIITFVHGENDGRVWVALSDGTRFVSLPSPSIDWFCVGNEVCAVGDVNGDGRADLISFRHTTADARVQVAFGNIDGTFSGAQQWHDYFCIENEVCMVGDVNGDNIDDIVAMGTFLGNTNIWVALSTQSSFGTSSVWSDSSLCREINDVSNCQLADVNGDGRDDIVEIQQSNQPVPVLDGNGSSANPGQVQVYLSTGSSYEWSGIWHDGFCIFVEAVCTVGDINGDNMADLLMFLRDSEPNLIGFDQRQGRVDAALSEGTAFGQSSSRYGFMCIGLEVCHAGDFNGDGSDDIAAFVVDTQAEPARGDVFVALSAIATPSIFIPPIQVDLIDTSWNAWLYESETRHLWQVDNAGNELQALTLPISELSHNLLSSRVGISHNGRYIAYFTQHNTNFDYKFQIYDISTQTMYSGIYRPDVNGEFQQHSLNSGGGTRVFSPDDRYLAISFQSSATMWSIHVIDMTASPAPRIAYSLNQSDGIVSGQLRESSGLPIIQQVTGTQVWFSYSDSLEGTVTRDSYMWDFVNGSLSSNRRYPSFWTDLLEETGEVIAVYQDEAYPNRLATLEYPRQHNVIQVYYPPHGNFIYYNNPDVSIEFANFVENGSRVLASVFEYDTNSTYWLLRERNGLQLERFQPPWQTNSLMGVPDGFIAVGTNLLADARGVLLHYDTRAGTVNFTGSIWNAPVGEFPNIVAVNYTPGSTSPGSWNDYQGNVITGSVTPINPDLVPTPESPVDIGIPPIDAGILIISGRASVYTTEGDVLNVRSGPGTDFSTVSQLGNGTFVTILEGPISANGYQWWRIRTDDGREGWSADFVDDLPTLIAQ